MSNLVTTGALDSGSITSGFGNIDNGASNITSGGLVKLDVDVDADDVSADSATGRLTLGAGEDLNLYHGGTHSYIVNDTGDLKIDTAGDLTFDAAGNDFKFLANGTEILNITNSSSDVVIKPLVDTKDIIFQQYDGNKIFEINDGNYVGVGGNATAAGAIRIYEDTDNGSHYSGFTVGNLTASVTYALPNADGSSGQALSTNGSGVLSWATVSANTPSSADGQALGSASLEWSDLFLADAGTIQFGNDQDVTLTHVADTGLLLNTASVIQFRDSAINIGSPADGDLDINADDEIELNSTLVDLNGNLDVSGSFTLAGTALTTTAAEINLIDGGATIGTTAVADGDGILHNDGGTMRVTSAATFKTYFQEGISQAYDDFTIGDAAVTISTSSGNITIDAAANDSDIIFKGTDGGADRTYMTIDGSAGGDLFLTGGLIDLKNDGSAVSQIKFYCESSNAHAQTLQGAPHAQSASNVLTLPSTGGNVDLVSTASTATLTNKTLTSPVINTATVGTSIVPASADGATLGTASVEFSDLFLADGGTIQLGNDQDVRIIHNADKGVILKHTATADDKPVSLTLQTGETDMAANDVIGAVDFQAPDEGTGTDAILVAAGIEAVSEGDFSSSSNATSLVFKTGASEAAAGKIKVTSAGHLFPMADDSYDLGGSSNQWRNIYTGDLHLSNMSKDIGNIVDGSKGDWTIQEGSSDLFLINNNSGKKYKFNLTEV